MSNASIWRAFRITRLCVYAISILFSIALAAIYAIFLIRGWPSFLAGHRAIMLVLLFIHALSSIALYLMMLIPFRIWADGARVALLLIFQVGGTVTFSLFYPEFPCSNLGNVSTCKRVELAAIFGGWALAGLLLIYAFALSAMCYVPEPPVRRLLIEDGPMTSQDEKEVYSEKAQKRLSHDSTGSFRSAYSQSSFSATHSPAFPSPPYKSGPPFSPMNPVQVQLPPPYYRPGTPSSIHSTSRSVDDIRELTRQRYYQSGLMPAPAPRFPPGLIAPPPAESLSRQSTTSSVRSAMSGRNGQRTQQPQRSVQFAMPSVNEYYEYPPANMSPVHSFDSNKMVRSPMPAWNGMPSRPPPRPLLLSPANSGYSPSPVPISQRISPPSSVRGYSPPTNIQPLPVPERMPSPPMAVAMNQNLRLPPSMPGYQQLPVSPRLVPTPLLPLLQIPQAGRESPFRAPSRTGSSTSSVPRSPSPLDTAFPYALPDRQQFAVLPAHPRLPPRTGSAMGFGTRRNDSVGGGLPYRTPGDGPRFDHNRSFSDSRGVVDNGAWGQLSSERNAAIDRWRLQGKFAP